MAQAKPSNTIDDHKTPLRSYLFEALSIAAILVFAAIAGCLIASNLEGKIAAQCTKVSQ
jgi:hypothetical protein